MSYPGVCSKWGKYDSDKIRVWICYEGIEDFG